MGVFDDVLQADQTLIKNENALDFEFVPKILPHREGEQRVVANSIKPLLQDRKGRNALLHGVPGIGKTAATKHVLRELEERTDDIYTIYINCWQNNTTYKILKEICDQIGYRFTHNKKTSELYDVVKKYINKASAVFIFDEVDKAEDYDFLYFILEDIVQKSVIMITNEDDFLAGMDSRIRSRMTPEVVYFDAYSLEETRDILKSRIEYAFYEDVWEDPALNKVIQRTQEAGDIRPGIFLLREAAIEAENRSSKVIELDDVETAIEKMDKFTINDQDELDPESQMILNIVEEHSGDKIGDLYDKYKEQGGTSVYKTFQRKIKKLDEGKFISTEKQTGEGGNTTIVSKKITDYE
jgi:cell division control protein 6